MSSFFISFAVVMATGIFMALMSKAVAVPVAANEAGKYLLKMHKSYKYAGYGSIILGVVIAACVLFIKGEDVLLGYISIAGLFLLFVLLGILCVLIFKNHYVIFDEEEIEVADIYKTIRFMKWENIVSAKYNKASGNIVVKGKDRSKINVHQHLVGIDDFLVRLKRKKGILVDFSL